MSPLPVLVWVYFAAIALGAAFGLGTLLGGGDSVSDASVDADTDVDLDAEADADADADGTIEHDVGSASPVEAWWSALGIGRVPFGLFLTINLFLFGGIGLVVSELLKVFVPPGVASVLALPAAVIVAPLLAGRLVSAAVRSLPALETYGATRDDLVGRLGHAELRIDEHFGRAKVVDEGGALHIVRCTTNGRALEPGAEIMLTERDPATGTYRAESSDFLGEGHAHSRRLS
jgi:hypothetical protein